MSETLERKITGRQVLIFTVGAFGIIIAVNLVMAWKAISTFPGLEARNIFVASQEFDSRRRAQEALGWTVVAAHDHGRMTLSIVDSAGAAVQVQGLKVLIGRPTSARDDVLPGFTFVGDHYEAQVPLEQGLWMVKLEALSQEGVRFEQRFDIRVAG